MPRHAGLRVSGVDRHRRDPHNTPSLLEGYSSGQRGQTVNLLAYAFGGSTNSSGTNLNSPQGWPRRGAGQDARSHSPPELELRSEISVRKNLEGYSSGQRGQTVNLLAYAFGGSNPPPSTRYARDAKAARPRRGHRAARVTCLPPCTRFIGFAEPVPVRDARVARPTDVPRRAGVVQW